MTQDYAEAAKWFRKAAEQGSPPAQAGLGIMYNDGLGVPQDYVQAYMWLNLAAARGGGDYAKVRDIVAERMTPAQIAEAQRLAREWKPLSRTGPRNNPARRTCGTTALLLRSSVLHPRRRCTSSLERQTLQILRTSRTALA